MINSRFIAGCDGAHSAVRHGLNIDFQGGSYPGDFVLGDVTIKWPFDLESIRIFFGKTGLTACFPFKIPGKFRFIVMNTGEPEKDVKDISEKEFHQLIERITGIKFEISNVHWLTRFKVSHRMVTDFKKENAFLCGDAAHIHSPAGGQGMNTGIQDALNLSHKLAAVIRQKHDPKLLLKYEKERKPVARAVLRGTNMASKMTLLGESPLRQFLMYGLAPRLLKFPPIQNFALNAVSEIKIARREIASRL